MDNRGRSYENALFQFCGPYKFGGPCMGDGDPGSDHLNIRKCFGK